MFAVFFSATFHTERHVYLKDLGELFSKINTEFASPRDRSRES